MMKYIVIRSHSNKEMMFVFPEDVVHARMFESVTQIRSGFPGDRNWDKPYYDAQIVSAGFINNGFCSGMSESLKVKSRQDIDTQLFKDGGMRIVAPLQIIETPEVRAHK